MSDVAFESAQAAFDTGRFAESMRLYQQALRNDPRDMRALYGLGLACLQAQQLQYAEYVLGELLRIDPQHADAHCVRGIALANLGRHPEALACFERALSLRPDSFEALSNYGASLSAMGDYDNALKQSDRAIAINPSHAGSWNNRGSVLKSMKRLEEAAECYSRALEINPGHRLAQENLDQTLFLLERLSRCPPALMRQLFDGFSVHYDDRMLAKLTYRGHEILRDLAQQVIRVRDVALRILDLGCGTGLAAEAFRDFANGGFIDGIDLSPRMIEAARARGLYRNLIVSDLESELASAGPHYDLILAADSLVYIGDLSACFAGASHRLESGGHLLFTTEAADGNGWKLTPSQRFAHSADYIRLAAENCGLQVVAIAPCISRTEYALPVAGFAVALRKC